jgi:HD-GYP domain-containing protein (c-di-GMP phosphodiesterase class II)
MARADSMGRNQEPALMSSASTDIISKDATPIGPVGSQRRLRLEASRLRRGIFVTELDRPWLDTPFLIQGFLADSDIEVQTLQRYCQYVYVDLDRCTPEVAAAIRAQATFDDDDFDDTTFDGLPFGQTVSADPDSRVPAPRDVVVEDAVAAEQDDPAPRAAASGQAARLPATRAYKVRADVRISRETRERFRSFVRGTPGDRASEDNETLMDWAVSRLRGLLGGSREAAASACDGPQGVRQELHPDIKASLPPGTSLTRYTDARSAAAELPRARQVFAHGDEVLAGLVGDIRNGRVPNLVQVDNAVDQMIESLVDNPDALLWVAQMREENLQVYQHGVRVSLYMMTLGRQLGLPRAMLHMVGSIGMLADVGKTRLPRALLDKPGMLNPAEYGIIKEHVRLGLEALAQGGSLAPEVELGIAQHHERLDGAGYPKGLKGAEISIYGRMAGIADCFAALSTPRAYANPLAAQDALMSLYQWADTSFHGPLVEQFVQAIGVFPVGTLVELSSGEVAVVVAHNRVRRLEPRVLLLTWPDKRALRTPIEVDLLNRTRDPGEKPLRVVRGLPSGAYGLRLRDYYADGSVEGAR